MAVDNTMTPQGYTGLSITPSARVLRWGDMSLSYDRQLPGARDTNGHNFVAGFGLLPGLELSGRIASNSIHDNCYTEGCGIRDLSANVKGGLSFGANDEFSIAIGGSDLGGAATNFHSYYGVGTFDSGSAQLSLGFAKRPELRAGRARSPLHGVFASAAYQPLSWLQGHVEYSDHNAWAGAKLFAPSNWLPNGWKAHAGLTARLVNKDDVTEKVWWSLGVSIPLYNVPRAPDRQVATSGVAAASMGATILQTAAGTENATALAGGALDLDASERRVGAVNSQVAPPIAVQPNAARTSAAPAPVLASTAAAAQKATVSPVLDSHLRSLAAALKAKGLEDISVGRAPDGAVAVVVNNATYNWNTLDAAGAALGAVSRELAEIKATYRLILTQRQTPLVALSGQTDCLKEWIDGVNVNCTAAELHTPGMTTLERMHDGVVWVVRDAAPSWHTLRLGLQPVLQSNVATEYGVFDYSVGLGINLQQPLWDGASVDVRYIAPLDESSDFEPSGVFGARRLREGVDRALLTQTLRLPLERWFGGESTGATGGQASGWSPSAVTAQVSLGKVSKVYNGAHGELRWEPGEGRHRFGAEAGYFKHKDKVVGPVYGSTRIEPRTSQPVLGSYRYHHLPTETFLELTGGRFLNHDRGVQVALRQWFDDTAVAVYYKRTRFEQEPESASFIGLEVSLPLGPRKDMSPGSLIQVRGTPRWAYGVETLSDRDNNNITTGHALRSALLGLNDTFNSDRAGVGYFENNMTRVRSAAR